MVIELYTKPSCNLCKDTKKWLNHQGFSYKETMIGEGITREEIFERFPVLLTGDQRLPVILVDGALTSRETLVELCLGGNQ